MSEQPSDSSQDQLDPQVDQGADAAKPVVPLSQMGREDFFQAIAKALQQRGRRSGPFGPFGSHVNLDKGRAPRIIE